MINLRYHIVSITAVFLALAIGVVMGTSFLSQATVDQLNGRITRAENGIRATRAESNQLKASLKRRVEEDENLVRQGSTHLFDGRLAAVPVLIVASTGVDPAALDNLRGALATSAADFKGSLIITDRLRLDGDGAAQMATLLGIPSADRAQIRRTLISRVADMLTAAGTPVASLPEAPTSIPQTTTSTTVAGSPTATTAPTTTPAPASPTIPSSERPTPTPPRAPNEQPALLTGLRDGGWLAFQPPSGGSGSLPLLTSGGYRYVFVSGTDVAVADRDFLLPLLRAMTASGPAPVVVASAATGTNAERARVDVVGPIRGDEVLKKGVSTVDNLELFSGLAAVILAVEDLGTSVHGHYGLGDGAQSLLPTSP